MGLLSKLRLSSERLAGLGKARPVEPGVVAKSADRPGPSYAPRNSRLSSGLKDCLWHLNGIGSGKLLDLGPVWQSTVSFFVERGFKVYTEDLLWAWKEFLTQEEKLLRNLPDAADAPDMSPGARADRFLQGCVQYPRETFDAVLVWDLLDYVDQELATRVVNRLTDLLKAGGVILALFHSRKPESFYRYRVLDAQNVELVAAPSLLPVQRILQNREILNLFGRFHSSKTYVGRDQLREGLFVK